jgi:hypothetical protein
MVTRERRPSHQQLHEESGESERGISWEGDDYIRTEFRTGRFEGATTTITETLRWESKCPVGRSSSRSHTIDFTKLKNKIQKAYWYD